MLAVEHELGPDDLDLLAAGPLRQLPAGLPCCQHGVLQHPALDDLPGLQGVVGLLDQVVADALLADVDDGVDAVGNAPQLGPLFTGQFHSAIPL